MRSSIAARHTAFTQQIAQQQDSILVQRTLAACMPEQQQQQQQPERHCCRVSRQQLLAIALLANDSRHAGQPEGGVLA